jgi:hypothetical protein
MVKWNIEDYYFFKAEKEDSMGIYLKYFCGHGSLFNAKRYIIRKIVSEEFLFLIIIIEILALLLK